MIIPINQVPDNMVAFRATGAITKDDFEIAVIPAVRELVARTGKLNYLLMLETPLDNFTIGAWWQDALLGLNNITRWNRSAIVSDSGVIRQFTRIFSLIVPGEFKGFPISELDNAIAFVSGRKNASKEDSK